MQKALEKANSGAQNLDILCTGIIGEVCLYFFSTSSAIDNKQMYDLIIGIGAIILIGMIDGWWDYRKYKKKHPETTFKEWWNLPEEDEDRHWWDE